jgi:hypothetical protein
MNSVKTQKSIFAPSKETKTLYIILSFITVLTCILGYMTYLYPKRMDTVSFIFIYFVMAFALVLVYSFFTKQSGLIKFVCLWVGFASLVTFICNLFMDYKKDLKISTDLQPHIGLIIASMFIICLIRYIEHWRSKNID